MRKGIGFFIQNTSGHVIFLTHVVVVVAFCF